MEINNPSSANNHQNSSVFNPTNICNAVLNFFKEQFIGFARIIVNKLITNRKYVIASVFLVLLHFLFLSLQLMCLIQIVKSNPVICEQKCEESSSDYYNATNTTNNNNNNNNNFSMDHFITKFNDSLMNDSMTTENNL